MQLLYNVPGNRIAFEFMNYFYCKLIVTLNVCRDTMYDILKGLIHHANKDAVQDMRY